MNENVSCQMILGAQCEPIPPRIISITLAYVYIVGGQDYPFSKHPVIKHQQSPVKPLKLVVPQNMENFRLGNGRVKEQSPIINQNPPYLGDATDFSPLVAPQIQEAQSRTIADFRPVQFI